jgi:hypothetical protein
VHEQLTCWAKRIFEGDADVSCATKFLLRKTDHDTQANQIQGRIHLSLTLFIPATVRLSVAIADLCPRQSSPHPPYRPNAGSRYQNHMQQAHYDGSL